MADPGTIPAGGSGAALRPGGRRGVNPFVWPLLALAVISFQGTLNPSWTKICIGMMLFILLQKAVSLSAGQRKR